MAATRKAAPARKRAPALTPAPARKPAAARSRANKTVATSASVTAFLDRAATGQRRADCDTLITMMRTLTREEPRMWGPSIVGFGTYHYVYASGHEGDSCVIGFSPRKADLTVYLMPGLDSMPELRRRLGPHKAGKVCLYLKGLAGIDLSVLRTMMRESIAFVRRTHGTAR
jgi:hypothetical protein